jgi:hypothetical protein
MVIPSIATPQVNAITPAATISTVNVDPISFSPTNDILTRQLDTQSRMLSMLEKIQQTLSELDMSGASGNTDTPKQTPVSTPERNSTNSSNALRSVVDLSRRTYDRKTA